MVFDKKASEIPLGDVNKLFNHERDLLTRNLRRITGQLKLERKAVEVFAEELERLEHHYKALQELFRLMDGLIRGGNSQQQESNKTRFEQTTVALREQLARVESLIQTDDKFLAQEAQTRRDFFAQLSEGLNEIRAVLQLSEHYRRDFGNESINH